MNRSRINLVQGALLRQLLLHSYCLLQQAHCPLAFTTAETSPTELEKTHFPKFNEFSVTTNAFHLPWELHLEHSCMETAGPEVTHQSPLVLHRHSLPLHCYLCTQRSVHWKPRPAMSWVGIKRFHHRPLFITACTGWDESFITREEILKEHWQGFRMTTRTEELNPILGLFVTTGLPIPRINFTAGHLWE